MVGCTAGSGPSASASGNEAPLSLAQLPAVWARYDRDNNAAIVRATWPTADPGGWSAVDGEVVLDGDLYSTAAQRYLPARERTRTASPFRHTSEVLYAGRADGWPRAVLTSYAIAPTGTATATARAEEPDWRGVALLVADSATAPWKMVANAPVATSTVPVALPPGDPSTPNGADLERALQAVQRAARLLETGRSREVRDSILAGTDLRAWTDRVRRLKASKGKGAALVEVTTRPYRGDRFVTGPGGTVRVVRVREGLLVMASYRLTESLHVTEGAIALVTGPYGVMTRQTAKAGLTYVTSEHVASVLLLVPPTGTPVLLGGDVTYVLPTSQGGS